MGAYTNDPGSWVLCGSRLKIKVDIHVVVHAAWTFSLQSGILSSVQWSGCLVNTMRRGTTKDASRGGMRHARGI